MKVHELKTDTQYFRKTLYGKKTFEIRLNDRDFKVGDVVLLREWHDTKFTGREIRGVITYILDDKFIGLKKGYVAISLGNLQHKYCGVWKTIRNNGNKVIMQTGA